MAVHPQTLANELSESAVRALEVRLRGAVVRSGNAEYDQARRVWNAAVDRYPALIVRPRDAASASQAVAFARANDLSFSAIVLRELGGAMARVPAEATAFAHRDKAFYLAIQKAWDDGLELRPERHVAWTEAFWRAIAPRTVGAYANLMGDEGEERVRAAYPPATYARLAEVKRRYDPDSLFRLNVNIRPA